MTFGKRIRMLREERRMLQSEVAVVAGVSSRVYGYYENDIRFPKDPALLSRLATFFDVSTDYLLGNSEERKVDLGKVEMHAHRGEGIGADLPEEAQEELRKYYEYLKAKYDRNKK
jgi:transcriptional regulator with XRE-family HTH domain